MMAYVITARSFEYNDEIYYVEGEGGHPVRLYFSKKQADEECEFQNKDWFFSEDNNRLCDFCYEEDELFNFTCKREDYEKFLKDNAKWFNQTEELKDKLGYSELILDKDIPKEIFEEFYKMCNLRAYLVHPVEVDESILEDAADESVCDS